MYIYSTNDIANNNIPADLFVAWLCLLEEVNIISLFARRSKCNISVCSKKTLIRLKKVQYSSNFNTQSINKIDYNK